ncbi:MAG: GPW/gp25 family protein [Spirochaetales bacterium]|nr:GPW/gp25 family protein [Spirochaetales bacterium]
MDFLGRGWRFPIKTNRKGGLSYSEGERDIEEAIWIILGTARGERLMLPEYGCGIHDLVFSPINSTTLGEIKHHVTTALREYEPRIEVLKVLIEQDVDEENKLLISIDYKVLKNNSFHNIVYPYFITERGGR